jgi:transposase
LAARRGKKRAAVAVGHPIRGSASHLLARQVADQDLGPHDLDERNRARVAKRLGERLTNLGDTVTREERPAAA